MTVEELRALLASSEAWRGCDYAEVRIVGETLWAWCARVVDARTAYADERARTIAQVLVAERVAVLALCDALEPHLSPDAPGPDPDQRARLKALLDSVRGAS